MADDDLGKQRLRPWLVALLNSGQVEGLRWLDDEKTKFSIPWYRQGRPNWTPENGQIFMEWARHTGHYRGEGVDDPKETMVVWKTRLRCALNKASGIKEIKGESKETDEVNPHKVYQFTQKTKTKRDGTTSKAKRATGTDQQAALPEHVPVANQVPLMVAQMAAAEDNSIEQSQQGTMPNDLLGIAMSELFPNNNTVSRHAYIEGMNALTASFSDMCVSQNDSMKIPSSGGVVEVNQPAPMPNYSMVVNVIYSGKSVLYKVIANQTGFRLHHGNKFAIEDISPALLARAFGPELPEDVFLPPCIGLMSDNKMETAVQRVLDTGLQGGIFVRFDGLRIYASRFCRCSIFYASELGTGGNPVKMNRCVASCSEETVIFDYDLHFKQVLHQYLLGEIPHLPMPCVYLLIGAEKRIADLNSGVPIYAMVASEQVMAVYSHALQQKNGTAAHSEARAKSIPMSLEMQPCNNKDEAEAANLPDLDLVLKILGADCPQQQQQTQVNGTVPMATAVPAVVYHLPPEFVDVPNQQIVEGSDNPLLSAGAPVYVYAQNLGANNVVEHLADSASNQRLDDVDGFFAPGIVDELFGEFDLNDLVDLEYGNFEPMPLS